MMKKSITVIVSVIFLFLYSGCKGDAPDISKNCRYKDLYTIDCGKHLIRDYTAKNSDGTINVVVEIPAGTIAKWEVDAKLEDGTKPTDGKLRWEFKKSKPRVVQYLSYPGNYGLIPGTRGGDGDPLDIILLSPSLPRGSVLRAKLLGVLKLIDGGDVDDKIIGVTKTSPLYHVANITDLDNKYPGAKEIIEIWFSNYKGRDKIKINGWGNIQEAESIIQTAIQNMMK